MAKTLRIPKPFGSYVVVRPKDVEEKIGSFVIASSLSDERRRGAMTEGTVVAIGPLAFKDDMNPSGLAWYKVGDRVIFVRHGGKIITYDNEMYGIFRYEDVMCGLDSDVDFQDGEKE